MVRRLFSTLLVLGLGACTAGGWTHEFGLDHPLAGQIVDVRAGRVIDEQSLLDRLGRGDFVLLGEKHDNADHHRLQARIIAALEPSIESVVFEMIDTGQQKRVVEYLSARPGDSAGLGPALGWSESGWPAWRYYEPVAAAALERGAEIVAGNLPRPTVKATLEEGISALPPELVASGGLDVPLAPSLESGLIAALNDSHCGYAPESQVPGMLLVQRARDALMADRLRATRGNATAVLIAGAGHVRTDWGVPYYLRRASSGVVVSLAFIEVDPEHDTLPGDLPYDYVWLTPRAQPPGYDPCDIFRQKDDQLEACASGSRPAA